MIEYGTVVLVLGLSAFTTFVCIALCAFAFVAARRSPAPN